MHELVSSQIVESKDLNNTNKNVPKALNEYAQTVRLRSNLVS